MRIVSWNCNGAFRRKFRQLDALDADVLVVQECENPATSAPDYRDWAGDHAWIGRLQSRGMGIFPRRGQRLEALPWPDADLRHFLPVRLDDRTNLVGVWTQHAKPQRASYVGQLWQYLALHEERLGPDTIIAGDFNSSAIWDYRRPIWSHSDCVRMLADTGLHSLYHLAHNEAHGDESQPTYFQSRNPQKPYHIDYIFAHEELFGGQALRATIGSAADWLALSDHMPIIVDL